MKSSFKLRYKFFLPALIWLLFIAFAAGPPEAAADTDNDMLGDYLNSAVFFEMFWEDYYDSTNFELLPNGKVYMYPLGTRDLSDFSWVNSQVTKGVRDYSWFLRLENMRYLVPFIKSFEPEHRQLLREWFEEWYEHHQELQKPNKAAWDWMTTAIRAMVFTYYLKQLNSHPSLNSLGERSDEDQLLFSHLMDTLFDHQQHLSEPGNYDDNSNHGMWEAMGLFETTRVFPNDQHAELAFERLTLIVDKSISKQGLHMEHSTSYHFHFLEWLQHYVSYLMSLEDLSWNGLEGLAVRLQAMLDAAYFMQDHEGNMPAIGDTDKGKVKDRFLIETTTDEDGLCFDDKAGYAIYKDHAESDLRRYIIFNIQKQHPKLPYHFHNDALAVYYSCMGEVILGDQGRYEYGRSPERSYFVSNLAHNTIVPANMIKKAGSAVRHGLSTGLRFVKNPVWEDRGDLISLSAELSYNLVSIHRKVLIPINVSGFEVTDSITGSAPVAILWNIGHDVESVDQIDHSADPNCVDTTFEWILHTSKQRNYSMSISVSEQRNEEEFSVDIYKGSEDPLLGWYAPTYLEKVPTTLIVVRVKPEDQRLVNVITRLAEIKCELE
jgi:hypothetical protein